MRKHRQARNRSLREIAVGRVGEGRRPLVGGHDQIGIVAIVADDVFRRHDLVAVTRLSVIDNRDVDEDR